MSARGDRILAVTASLRPMGRGGVFAVVACFMSMLPAVSIGASQPIEARAIDRTVARTMQAFDVPGIAVGIVKDGQLVFSKGYGVREQGKSNPVGTRTLFQIGSNTKAFTAAALAMLVDAGKLRWDDRVIDYLPQFRLYDAYVTREFTIRDLLSHRSGLGTGAGDLMLLATGVATAPGIDFDPVDGRYFIRMSFAISTDQVEEALRRLTSWLGAVTMPGA